MVERGLTRLKFDLNGLVFVDVYGCFLATGQKIVVGESIVVFDNLHPLCDPGTKRMQPLANGYRA